MKNFNLILLIDDDEVCNFLNEKIIKMIGMASTIRKLYNGREALDYFLKILKTNQNELLPEIIFLDINMPEMDGIQFLEEFKRINNPLKDTVKIFILTSSVDKTDRLVCSQFNIAGYIQKPLTVNKLEEIMQKNVTN